MEVRYRLLLLIMLLDDVYMVAILLSYVQLIYSVCIFAFFHPLQYLFHI